MKILIVFFIMNVCWAQLTPFADKLANTYSIVARDAKTGEMGVAVQSHYFGAGRVVPWAERWARHVSIWWRNRRLH